MLKTTINGIEIVAAVERGDATYYTVTIDGLEHVRTPHADTAADYLKNAVDWANQRSAA